MSASESQEGVRGDHLYEGGNFVGLFSVCGFVFCGVGSASSVEELGERGGGGEGGEGGEGGGWGVGGVGSMGN